MSFRTALAASPQITSMQSLNMIFCQSLMLSCTELPLYVTYTVSATVSFRVSNTSAAGTADTPTKGEPGDICKLSACLDILPGVSLAYEAADGKVSRGQVVCAQHPQHQAAVCTLHGH